MVPSAEYLATFGVEAKIAEAITAALGTDPRPENPVKFIGEYLVALRSAPAAAVAAAPRRRVLAKNDDLPIRTDKPVHSGKVRAVYWLTAADSKRLIETRKYDVAPDAELAIMVISDRISAYECIWRGEGGLLGVPGKGAALNAISNHWFRLFKQKGLARSHILEVPHPLVWVVQRAAPVMIEAIIRQYITGSMWRSYVKGARTFCGLPLPDGLQQDARLPSLLITPSTKGVMVGIPGVPEVDDVNVSREQIAEHHVAFGFDSADDIATYETLLTDGFTAISDALQAHGQLLVDTKFEFGYASDASGKKQLIYMDEVGTPDSSRIWDGPSYAAGTVLENSKEGFRKALQAFFPDPDILLNKDRMEERYGLARDHELPLAMMDAVSKTYVDIAEKITGEPLPVSDDPRAEIIEVLRRDFDVIV
jgi:phosphoribosylaminoimidazole-succinocarboxamide synthase